MSTPILVLLLACNILRVDSRRSFSFTFTNINCVSHTSALELINCWIQEVKNTSTIFIDFVVAEDVPTIRFDFLLMLPNQRQDMVLINVTAIDGCAFLSGNSPYTLVRIIRKEFAKYSNFPTKCPVTKGTAVHVREMKIDPKNFPSYVPDTKFYCLARVYNGKERFFDMAVNGSCKTDARYYKGFG